MTRFLRSADKLFVTFGIFSNIFIKYFLEIYL